MANKEGTSLSITLATVAIEDLTDIALTMDNVVIDATSFDSAGNRDILMGTTSWSITCTAFVNGAATQGFSEAFTAMQAKTAIAIVYTYPTTEAGDFILTGSAYIASISNTGSIGSAISYSITLEGDGILVQTLAV